MFWIILKKPTCNDFAKNITIQTYVYLTYRKFQTNTQFSTNLYDNRTLKEEIMQHHTLFCVFMISNPRTESRFGGINAIETNYLRIYY